METKTMYSIRKHSIVLRPGALDTVLGYTRYFARDMQTKLDDYQAKQVGQHGQDVNSDLTLSAKHEIARADEMAQDIELLRDELDRIYIWHFEQLAEVMRQVRLHLETDRIDDLYTVKIVLGYLMQMLQSENPKFNPSKFIRYINADPEEVAYGATA